MILDFSNDKFYELMKEDFMKLPQRCGKKDYIKFLEQDVYSKYNHKLAALLEIDEKHEIFHISSKIIQTINEYYNGFPSKAYQRFKELMTFLWENPIRTYNKSSWGDFFGDTDPLKLYRLRKVDDEFDYSRKDIFHTPFSKRNHVSSCRYSIAGYPSLYLSTSLYLCDLEVCGGDNNFKRIASRFQLNRDLTDNGNIKIKVIELALKPEDFKKLTKNKAENDQDTDRFDEIDLKSKEVQSNYLLWYPLIAACSVICINKQNPFHSEYIIPQLLTQWLREESNEDELVGIRYFSCKSERASKQGINYMFPTDYGDGEYCGVLSRVFKLTKPVYVNEFTTHEQCEKHMNSDMIVDTIEII